MTGEVRILDANLNRAREALRVMEDIARLGLNDAPLAADLKDARHAVRPLAEAAGLDSLRLAAWRDTPGDVGVAFTTPAEQSRAGIRDIAVAAGKRAGEALRVTEETLKVLPAPASASSGAAKALRYRVYELERRLILALGAGRAPQWRLCILITESLCTHAPWEAVATEAVSAGADCLQLREKNLDGGELLARARRLVDLARPRGVSVIINDRPDIALLAGAHGVHLGQSDLSVLAARRICGADLLVGVSTTNLDQATRAAADGADYCGLGPMFATTTKHKPVLAGPAYLREYLAGPQTARIPHLAIGGITADNARELARAGCRGVAVSSAVCAAQSPAQACAALLRSLADPQ